MKTPSFVTRLLLTLAVSLAPTASARAQTFTLNSTTTAAAVAATDTSISVTSASAASGSSFGSIAVGQQIYVVELPLGGRGEIMAVTSVSSTTIGVQRRDRPRAHPSGALIFIGNAAAYQHASPPNGACSSSAQGDPWVDVDSGSIWRCVSSLWARVLADDSFVGLPKPAAATALNGANTLAVTGGAGGATTTATSAGGVGGAPSVTGGLGGAGSTSGAGGAGGAVANTGGVGGTPGTTGTGGAGGATSAAGGVGGVGGTSSGTGGVGGAGTTTGGVGGAGTAAAATGGVGGAFTAAGGVGGASGSAGTGGVGGAASVTGGAGGGTITGGAGGAATLKAGAGGNGSTAGGSGGDVVLQAGAVGTGGTGSAGLIKLKDAADVTKVLSVSLAGATTATTTTLAVSPAASATLTMPGATGGLPIVLYCGSTGTGNQTCSPSAAAVTTKIYMGHSTLSTNAAVITFSPAFASTTYDCVANDITTRANPVQMLSTSNSTATITNTTGGSDVINWICVGQ